MSLAPRVHEVISTVIQNSGAKVLLRCISSINLTITTQHPSSHPKYLCALTAFRQHYQMRLFAYL